MILLYFYILLYYYNILYYIRIYYIILSQELILMSIKYFREVLMIFIFEDVLKIYSKRSKNFFNEKK